MYKIKIEKYSGPLDLLLQLIEQQKLEITEISLSEVTEQYLIHIEALENRDPEELADFLVVAARLLLLKSKALLPELEIEEELDELEKQLKLYKEYLEASKKIATMIGQEKFTFSRAKSPQKTEIEFSPPPSLKMNNLRDTFLVVLKGLDPLVKLPRQYIERTVSLQQKIFDIREFLAKNKKMGFRAMIGDAKSKTEVIMNFLAILELVKQQHLKVRQGVNFEDIMIEKIGD